MFKVNNDATERIKRSNSGVFLDFEQILHTDLTSHMLTINPSKLTFHDSIHSFRKIFKCIYNFYTIKIWVWSFRETIFVTAPLKKITLNIFRVYTENLFFLAFFKILVLFSNYSILPFCFYNLARQEKINQSAILDFRNSLKNYNETITTLLKTYY